MRIVELDSGTITIDGEDIRSHGLSKLRKVSGRAVLDLTMFWVFFLFCRYLAMFLNYFHLPFLIPFQRRALRLFHKIQVSVF